MLAQRSFVDTDVSAQSVVPVFEDCSETSASIYQSTLRNVPEVRRSHLHSGSILKLRVILTYMVFDFSGTSFRQTGFGTFRIF